MNRTVHTLMLAGFCWGLTLISTAAPIHAAPPAPTPAPAKQPEAPAKVSSPVGLLYQAYQLESTSQTDQAIQIYQQIIAKEKPDSRWGQMASLCLVRCQLARAKEPKLEVVAQTLSNIPAAPQDPSIQRERDLWQYILALHELAAKWAQSSDAAFDVKMPAELNTWRVPTRIREDVYQAVNGLRRNFMDPGKARRGAQFFATLIGQTTNPLIQQPALKHLCELRLAAGDVKDAAVTVRAYWLSSMDESDRLSDAIDQVANVMSAEGADKDAIDAFRYRQMLGRDMRPRPTQDPLRPSSASGRATPEPADKTSLFNAAFVAAITEPTTQARVLLLNGDLATAVPLLQEQLKKQTPGSDAYDRTLQIVQMAFALHDGHLHAIDRYERFLYAGNTNTASDATIGETGAGTNSGGSGTSGGDPLAELASSLKNDSLSSAQP